MKLEIGCGLNVMPGFVHLDWNPWPEVDVLADARDLPFEDNTATMIYSAHMIEHVPQEDHPAMFREWLRVLKPYGILELIFPNEGDVNYHGITTNEAYKGAEHLCSLTRGDIVPLLESMDCRLLVDMSDADKWWFKFSYRPV